MDCSLSKISCDLEESYCLEDGKKPGELDGYLNSHEELIRKIQPIVQSHLIGNSSTHFIRFCKETEYVKEFVLLNQLLSNLKPSIYQQLKEDFYKQYKLVDLFVEHTKPSSSDKRVNFHFLFEDHLETREDKDKQIEMVWIGYYQSMIKKIESTLVYKEFMDFYIYFLEMIENTNSAEIPLSLSRSLAQDLKSIDWNYTKQQCVMEAVFLYADEELNEEAKYDFLNLFGELIFQLKYVSLPANQDPIDITITRKEGSSY